MSAVASLVIAPSLSLTTRMLPIPEAITERKARKFKRVRQARVPQRFACDPRESFEVAASRTNTPIPADKHFHQAKLYAPVTKRKLDHDHNESVKKMRTEGVGLGIGFESGRL